MRTLPRHAAVCVAALLLAACETLGGPRASGSPAPSDAAAPTRSAAPTVRIDPSVVQPPPGWRRIADIPTARSEVAAAVFRGGVFVIGGFGGGRVVERLGGQPASWSRVAELPIEVDHAMAAGVDVDGAPGVYVMGGNVNGTATARAFRWFGDEGWREIAAMPAPRSQAAAVAIGSRIYVVGGQAGGVLVSPTFVYDLATGRWATRAAIPTPRDHLAAVALAGRVCAAGGRRLSLDANLASLECYDPSADRWERLADAPTARGGVGAAVVGDRLFFVGGEQPRGTFREVEIYDATARAWSRGPDLPTPRHGIGVAALGSTLYVLTGGPTPGGSQTAACEALDVP